MPRRWRVATAGLVALMVYGLAITFGVAHHLDRRKPVNGNRPAMTPLMPANKPMPPAARVTDMHVCPLVTGVVPHVGGPILPPCAIQVLIGGLPAARITDLALCVGPPDMIVMG